jgi:hypothetical protein
MGWAAFATLAAWTLFSFVLFAKSEQSIRHAENRVADLKAQRKADAELIAELRHDVEMAECGEMDLRDRLTRIRTELAEAQERGEKAAVAAMEAAIHRRDEYEESLQAWQSIAAAALLLGAKPPKGLPKAAAKPKALPRGGYIVEGKPPVIVPDKETAGFEYFAEAVPARVNGARR